MELFEMKQILKDEAEKLGLSEYEIYYESGSNISAETLKDEISAFSSGVDSGVSFRTIVDGKMGYASTALLTEDELRAIVYRAAENAKYQDHDGEVFLYEGSPKYETVKAELLPTPSAAELKETALRIQKEIYASSEAVTDGTQSAAYAFENEILISNSHGLELHNHISNTFCLANPVVKKDGDSQFGFEHAEGISESDSEGIAQKAVEKALSKIGASTIPSGKYNVVFSGSAMRSLLSTFSGVFSAKNAELGLSLLKGKEGERIASSAVTLLDDPMRDGCRIQTAFDAEGVATYKKAVIEEGRLNTLLYDLSTAKKAGKQSTGNGLRGGYTTPIRIRPFNFYFQPGTCSEEELFALAGDGSLYVTNLNGLHAGADATTGDFSLESAGFLVEKGKKGRAVKSFTIAGNFFSLLKEIDSVGNDVEFGIPGGFTLFGSPDVLVKGMSVAGKDN